MPNQKPNGKPPLVPPPRYANGNHPEKPTGKPPTLIKRIFDHAEMMALDPRVATELGRLRLQRIISEPETEAGMAYAADAGAYERVKQCPRRHARSPSFDGGYAGVDIDVEALRRLDPERATRYEKGLLERIRLIVVRFEKARATIPTLVLADTVDELLLNDRAINSRHYEDLRTVLRRLALHYRIPGVLIPLAKRRIAEPPDAVRLVAVCCDGLERWFAARNGRITHFRLVLLPDHAGSRAVHVLGEGRGGNARNSMARIGVLERTGRVPRRGLLPVAIDAQIVRTAISRGWADAADLVVSGEVTRERLEAAIARLNGKNGKNQLGAADTGHDRAPQMAAGAISGGGPLRG